MSIKKFTPPTNGNWGNLGFIKSLVLMVVMIVTTGNACAFTLNGLSYTSNSDGKSVTLIKSENSKYSGEINIPKTITVNSKTYEVTALGEQCFKECSLLTGVKIPSTVKSIGIQCFYKCTQLSSIDIPNSVESLGGYSFYGCSLLNKITIPNSVTTIGLGCFVNCTFLSSITIPSSVTSMDTDCFIGCTNLTSATIHASISSLGEYTFNGCTNLKSVYIDSPITSIGDYCFKGCTNLDNVTIPSSINSLGKNCFQGCAKLQNIIIPSSVSEMPDYCFDGCSSLINITIPSSATSIGYSCFGNCSSLNSIIIPSSVAIFGSMCFNDCTNLEAVFFKGTLPSNIYMSNIPTTCTIYVPKGYLEDYKKEMGARYPKIREWDGGDIALKCERPTIAFKDGKLLFSSPTPDAKFHYSITDADMANNQISENGIVALSATYKITAYTTSAGYEPSNNTTATLQWTQVSIGTDNPTNINQIQMRGIVATSDGGIVSLSGLNDGEMVRFYSLDGKQIGVSRAENGTASYAVGESIVIAKFSNNAIKIKSN